MKRYFTVSDDLIYDTLTEIAEHIEKGGANEHLTEAITLTTALQRSMGNEFNRPDHYELLNLIELINRGVKKRNTSVRSVADRLIDDKDMLDGSD